MIAYFDSSALVKLAIDEAESPQTIAFGSRCERTASSIISRAEVAAALAQAARTQRISLVRAHRAERLFLEVWTKVSQMPLDEGLVIEAGHLTWSHELRGHDAVQLASALRLRAAAGPVVLACFDRRLRAAAGACGFELWPA